MATKTDLPISSCWIVTEGLIGLQNQAIGLAQALGVSYTIKEIKKPRGLWQLFFSKGHGLTAPWPDLLISCGRQSVAASIAVRRASENKTFTVHIQHPLVDCSQFDCIIVPDHDGLQGDNVFVTQGAIHQVTTEKLMDAASHFSALLKSQPRPLISVLVGGKNRHQDFSAVSVCDLARKLRMAVTHNGGSLAMTTSRRTGAKNEKLLRRQLDGISFYMWDGQGENPYLGLLALADAIVVTSDSISMICEACSTGKPVYIYQLPHCGRRHKHLCESLIEGGYARPFSGTVESWEYTPLDETRRAANFIYERFAAKRTDLKLNVVH